MAALRNQMSGQISVEVDAVPQPDLASIMSEIREEYEAIAKKNNKALEDWYNKKVRVKPKPIQTIHPFTIPASSFRVAMEV